MIILFPLFRRLFLVFARRPLLFPSSSCLLFPPPQIFSRYCLSATSNTHHINQTWGGKSFTFKQVRRRLMLLHSGRSRRWAEHFLLAPLFLLHQPAPANNPPSVFVFHVVSLVPCAPITIQRHAWTLTEQGSAVTR